jgi:hypothetical protein
MPRTTAKARRRALAARIVSYLLHASSRRGTRLVVVDESAGPAKVEPLARDLGGWCESALIDVIEAHLRPGQRRRADRPRP